MISCSCSLKSLGLQKDNRDVRLSVSQGANSHCFLITTLYTHFWKISRSSIQSSPSPSILDASYVAPERERSGERNQGWVCKSAKIKREVNIRELPAYLSRINCPRGSRKGKQDIDNLVKLHGWNRWGNRLVVSKRRVRRVCFVCSDDFKLWAKGKKVQV